MKYKKMTEFNEISVHYPFTNFTNFRVEIPNLLK